jgi:hypothetical protein
LPSYWFLFTKTLNSYPSAIDRRIIGRSSSSTARRRKCRGRTPAIGTAVTLNRMAAAAVKWLGEFGRFRQLNSSDLWERVRR